MIVFKHRKLSMQGTCVRFDVVVGVYFLFLSDHCDILYSTVSGCRIHIHVVIVYLWTVDVLVISDLLFVEVKPCLNSRSVGTCYPSGPYLKPLADTHDQS